MTNSQQILLLLLNRAINRSISTREPIPQLTAAEDLSSKIWTKIIAMAEAQEVSGLVFDSLESIPKEQQPSADILMRWTATICSLERDYLLYEQQCIGILQKMQSQNLPFVLLKGLLLARLFPQPKHRPIGDVDIFVAKEALKPIVAFFEKEGGVIDKQFDHKHISAQLAGLNWEIHFKSMYFYSRRTERRYRQLETEESQQTSLCLEQLNEEMSVWSFPPILDIVYLTAHIQHHLILEEICLRHVVDWMLALHHNRTALGITETQLIKQLKALNLLRLYRALGYIAVQYLGMSDNSYAALMYLSNSDRKRGEYLLKIILKGHIPGCRPYQPRTPEESFATKVRLYGDLLLRCIQLRTLVPREAMATPLGFLINALRRRKKEMA